MRESNEQRARDIRRDPSEMIAGWRQHSSGRRGGESTSVARPARYACYGMYVSAHDKVQHSERGAPCASAFSLATRLALVLQLLLKAVRCRLRTLRTLDGANGCGPVYLPRCVVSTRGRTLKLTMKGALVPPGHDFLDPWGLCVAQEVHNAIEQLVVAEFPDVVEHAEFALTTKAEACLLCDMAC